MTDTATRLLCAANQMAENADYQIEKFKQAFSVNPAHAFEWSQVAFTAAAQLQAAQAVRHWLTNDENPRPMEERLEAVTREMNRLVRRAARYPSRSSSPQSNIMEQETGAAFAALLEKAEEGF